MRKSIQKSLTAFVRIATRGGLVAVALFTTACELKGPEFFEPTQLDISVFTGSVAGTVTINGSPAAGVTVSSGNRTTTTLADGSYVLIGLPLGPNRVTILGLPTGATCTQTSVVTTVTANNATRLDFPCTQTGSVAGAVTVNGVGTAGIAVAVGARSTSTGAGGAYRIDGLNPGSVLVTVAPPANATCSPSLQQATVAGGATATVNFACTVPTTGSVTGVVTVNGTPTAGISITAGGKFATTGAGGAYRIDDLPLGATQVSIADAIPNTTCSPSSQSVTIVISPTATANFACTRPTVGSLTGTVTINGVPAAGITVIAGSRTATTGSNGTYRLDNLAPGQLQVSILELPPNTTCNPGSQAVTIDAGQTAIANFACTQPTTGSVTGTVTLDGQPWSGRTLTVGMASANTAGNGTYTIAGLLPGLAIVTLTGIPANVACLPAATQSVSIAIAGTATANFVCVSAQAYVLTVLTAYVHLSGFSRICASVSTSPGQPNADYTATLSGPGVGTGSLSGKLTSLGAALLLFDIFTFGLYNGLVNTAGPLPGMTTTTSFSMNVTSAAGAGCPNPP